MKICIRCGEQDELKLRIMQYFDGAKTDAWWMCRECVGNPDGWQEAKDKFYGNKSNNKR